MRERTAFRLIKEHYGSDIANRSKLPLINHIDEGLIVLHELGADANTIDAYCLHPLLQNDASLGANYLAVSKEVNALTMLFAIEYRSIANEHLSTSALNGIRLSPLHQVNQMLIADKVQNRKDFELYHKGTHPRSAELERYFARWLARLSVSEEFYQHLCSAMTRK